MLTSAIVPNAVSTGAHLARAPVFVDVCQQSVGRHSATNELDSNPRANHNENQALGHGFAQAHRLHLIGLELSRSARISPGLLTK
jgi:hypothetical protein